MSSPYSAWSLRWLLPSIVMLALLSGLTRAATADKDMLPYHVSYSAEYDGIPISGNAERTLKQNSDGSWSLDFEASMLVYSFSETSRFRVSNGQIQPLAYHMKKGSFGQQRSAAVNFLWDKKQANSSEKDRHWTLPLQRTDQDRISYQQQLQQDLNSGKKQFSYPVISGDERDNYTFQLDGEELLKTPLGQLATVRLKRVRKGKKRETWVWLARDWNYLLVQLRQVEKKKRYLVSVKQATINGKPVTGKPVPQTAATK